MTRAVTFTRTTQGEVIGPEHLTRTNWAAKLNDQWDQIRESAVAGFVQLGHDLHQAKADLSAHGHWQALLECDLKFNPNTARAFMRIATWVENVGIAHVLQQLPPDYTTIDKIARLDEITVKQLVDDGTICPTLQRNEVSKILRLQRVRADEQRVLQLVPVPGKFRTLVLDPAWDYDWLSLAGRAKPGYAMQSHEDLLKLDVRQWADEDAGCHLYLWTTNNFMGRACELVARWGFQHRTVITWIKPTPFGLGSYFRNSTEHVLFATLGDTTTRPAATVMPTHFEASRGEHSEKPEKFYDIVRVASYPPYGEGNQREARPDFKNLFELCAGGGCASH